MSAGRAASWIVAQAGSGGLHRGLDAHIHMDSVAFWGFVATVVMTTILSVSQGLRLTRMSFPLMLGTMASPDWERARMYGFGMHVLNGWLFSIVYALAFETWDRATWWLGAGIGLIHGIFVVSAILPLLPAIHPRMARPYQQSDEPMLLEPPGFMGLNYGRETPVITIAAHVVYGAILGSFYQLTGD